MLFKTIIGFLLLFSACLGKQIPKGELPNESGLSIENGINRGLNYTDPLGTKYSYRYIPITITNDSSIAIQIHIDLSKEYDYPDVFGDQKFKVFLVPKEITEADVTWDSLSYELGDNKLRQFFELGLNAPYILNETLEPGQKCELTMGTLYPRPTNCGVLPNALFTQNNSHLYYSCDSLNKDKSPYHPLKLGLKLDFCEGCTLIPCGQISFPKNKQQEKQ